MARTADGARLLPAPWVPRETQAPDGAAVTAVPKPCTRDDLIFRVLDPTEGYGDRAIAARQLVRQYPAKVKSVESLVELVCPLMDPSPGTFDLLADALADVREQRAARPVAKLK